MNSGFAKDDQSRIKRGWSTVQRNAERIKAMVSDILYYAKDRVPSWETVSAEEIARDVVTMMESRAGELATELGLEIGEAAGEFDGDPQALRALLANLVENSLDACRLSEFPEGHRVVVRVSGEADGVRFEVEDDGMGMDQETQEKAFSLFFSTKGTGTGLGLFISHKIARAHGGDIDLYSKLGEGTKFVVTLPRVRPNESGIPDSPMTKGITIDA